MAAAVVHLQPEGGAAPKGVVPLYLTPDMLEDKAFALVDEEEESLPFVWINKQQMLDHVQKNGKISDWYPAQETIKSVSGDVVLVVYDEDTVFEENYYLCDDVMAAKWSSMQPTAETDGGEASAAPEGETGPAPEGEGGAEAAPSKPAEPVVPKPPLKVVHPGPHQADGGPPGGCQALYIPEPTLIAFGLKADGNAEPYKFISKAEMLNHIQVNGKVSDWYDAKATIEKVKAEEVLVVYDENEVMGESYYICGDKHTIVFMEALKAAEAVQEEEWKVAVKEAKVAQKAAIRQARIDAGEDPEAIDREEEEAEVSEDEEEEEEVDLTIRELQPTGHWEDQGSEAEVRLLTVCNSRDLVEITLKKKLRHFGAAYNFYDTDAADQDSVDIRSAQVHDPMYALSRKLAESSAQAVPELCHQPTQTTWFRKQNAVVQYEPIEWDEDKKEEALSTQDMADFLVRTRNRYELALQQNEVVNMFEDSYKMVAEDDDINFGQKTDEEITETQNFTEKTRSVIAIDWQPRRKGVVAVACRDPRGADQRVESAGVLEKSSVLIYDFTESIVAMEPILVLEAPDDIFTFRFNPTMPHLVAGGTAAGQVVLWDIEAAQSVVEGSQRSSTTATGDDKGKSSTTQPPVPWCLMSLIEASHTLAVSDLRWLPVKVKISPKGKTEEINEPQQWQFISGAADGQIIVWDASYKKDPVAQNTTDPLCYDVNWGPTWKINLTSMEGTSALSIERLSVGPGASWMASTQEAEVAIGEGYGSVSVVKQISICHRGPIVALAESPFLEGVFLTVGDWAFHVWKQGISEPLFSSPFRSAYLTCGRWSPTRPAVIMVGRQDGTLEAWDLMGRMSAIEPSATVVVASCPLTYMEFANPVGAGSAQYLAVGDHNGTLHVMEMPRNLCRATPTEAASVEGMFERETARVAYVKMRQGIRADEYETKKAEAEKAAAAAKAAAPPDDESLTEEEATAAKEAAEAAAKEKEMVALEAEYAAAEAEFRKMLGLDKEEGEEDDI